MAAPRKTTSRKPRTAARAASRPSTSRTTEPDAGPEVTPAEAQEIEAEGHYVTAELCGEEVQIVPASAWRSSWQRMLHQGDFDSFARNVFSPEDYEFYLELDPTIAEFLQFTQDAAASMGESLGNSRGPATSSRSTRRR
ncbi:hypothetical protein [Streptomyces ziwulingensis]|uniref:Uncharacterized protein n=1 Tax=Streptomyces ziwulingensis TaxID=1045501 RepID=A0ABP9BRQ2_9ACTN